MEISYGVYLYGFLIEQTLMHFMVRNNISLDPVIFIFVAYIISIIFGILTFKLVEEPTKTITKTLLKKLHNKSQFTQNN